MNHWTDSQLFDALREGNKQAMSILFLRHYDFLIHYGLQLSSNRSNVEECLQELFIYLYEASGRLGRINQVRAYLFKALRRRILDKLKQEQRLESQANLWLDKVDIQFLPDHLHDANLRSEKERNRLTEALNSLPWRQREAIYLRYYNGLNTKEIAEIMGAANQTVLNTLYQALQNLRKQVKLKDIIGCATFWFLIS